MLGVWQRWRKAGGRGNGSSDKHNSPSAPGPWVGAHQWPEWGEACASTCGHRADGRCSRWLLSSCLLCSACPKHLPTPAPCCPGPCIPVTSSVIKERGLPSRTGLTEVPQWAGARMEERGCCSQRPAFQPLLPAPAAHVDVSPAGSPSTLLRLC